MPIDVELLTPEEAAHHAEWQAQCYEEYLADLDRKEFEAAEAFYAAQEELAVAKAKVNASRDADKWRDLFHTKEQIENAPPIAFAIQDFLQDDSVTVLAGLPGHGKTLIALAISQALLRGGRLFDLYAVNRKAERVLYLVPESALTPFVERLKAFRLVEYAGERLFVRTLSMQGGDLAISDPRLLAACKGADVILDTAIRFLPAGTDENNSGEMRVFSRQLFALLQAGAKTVTALHHSPKGSRKATQLDLENMLRGSGDLGGMCATAWASYQIDKDNCKLYVENVKARDFQAGPAFVLEGRPHLDDTGEFKLLNADCENLRAARKDFVNRDDSKFFQSVTKAKELHSMGRSFREIGEELAISHTTARRWVDWKN